MNSVTRGGVLTMLATLVLLGACAQAPPGGPELKGPSKLTNLWDPCAFAVVDDKKILGDVQQEIDQYWPFSDAPMFATLGTPVDSLGHVPGIAEFCEGPGNCDVPVLVWQKKDSNGEDRCWALLPFRRFCVRKDAEGRAPKTVHFVLATLNPAWTEGSKVERYLRRTDGDYQFIDPADVPPFGQAVGIHLHELHATGRRPLAKDYFNSPQRSPDGLVLSWTVGLENTADATRPRADSMIGRVAGGVMAAGLVHWHKAGSGNDTIICKPRDPIVVNTAN